MRLLQALRNHGPGTDAANADTPGDSQSPIAGYDRLGAREVIARLAQSSQSELATIEAHERAHRDRAEVLNKLRYLRGSEPLPDYDTLDPKQISSALADADLDTAKAVREYERKFKRRSGVLEAVTAACHARQTGPRLTNQATGAASAGSG